MMRVRTHVENRQARQILVVTAQHKDTGEKWLIVRLVCAWRPDQPMRSMEQVDYTNCALMCLEEILDEGYEPYYPIDISEGFCNMREWWEYSDSCIHDLTIFDHISVDESLKNERLEDCLSDMTDCMEELFDRSEF